MEIKSLNFDHFHPLDHWPFGRECAGWHGGWRNHLSLAWEFKWQMRLRKATSCRLGMHRPCEAELTGSDETFWACWFCGVTLNI